MNPYQSPAGAESLEFDLAAGLAELRPLAAVLRNVALLFVWVMGASYLMGGAADGTMGYCLVLSSGFLLVGCLERRRRFARLAWTTFGFWCVDVLLVINGAVTIGWLLPSALTLICAAVIGGCLASLIVKAPPKPAS